MSAPTIVRPNLPMLIVPMLPTAGFLRPSLVTEIVRRPAVRSASPAEFSCGDYLKYLENDE